MLNNYFYLARHVQRQSQATLLPTAVSATAHNFSFGFIKLPLQYDIVQHEYRKLRGINSTNAENKPRPELNMFSMNKLVFERIWRHDSGVKQLVQLF